MIIISNRPGQLGNLLFIYAKFIAYGIENDTIVLNPAFLKYKKYFEKSRNTDIPSFPVRRIYFFGNGEFFYKIAYYTARLLHLLKVKNKFIGFTYLDWNETLNIAEKKHTFSKLHFIQGWQYENFKYLDQHRATIKDHLTPIKEIQASVNKFMKKLQSDCDIVVGIHVRRGDYKEFENGRYYYSIEDYYKIICKVKSLFKKQKVNFLVCSNENISFSNVDSSIYFGVGGFIEDMHCLSLCDYLLGPPSTFSIWASYIGNTPLYQIKDLDKSFGREDFKLELI